MASTLAATLTGCDLGSGPDPLPPPDGPPPYEPSSPQSYVAKVKNLLIGQPATDEDVRAVAKDPAALRGLIDAWMAQPQFQDKALGFFRNAFQQGQLNLDDLDDQLPERVLGARAQTNSLMQNVQESFPRTAWQLVREGRPLSDAITTQRHMLTPALMALYAYLDVAYVDDAGKLVNRITQQDKTWQVSFVQGTAIPLADSVNPGKANYLKFYNPSGIPDGCKQEPAVYGQPHALFTFLFGSLPAPTPRGSCPNRVAVQPLLADSDFTEWRMVTIRAPKAGEATTPFFDLPALRKGGELVLRVPRPGFFSTPAFLANWATNSSNQARVTINQTLIVALGKSFDDTNSTVPINEAALSKEHAGPGTVCYGCHKTLDPMRQFFRQSYTLRAHEQLDADEINLPASFAFDGVSAPGRGVGDLARLLSQHPRFGRAWAQKLCYYANSAACVEDDPEFLRVVDVFERSRHDFKVLVRELFSSPLTTAAQGTKTFAERGVTISISRRDHLCVALSQRLGLPDVCGLSGRLDLSAAQKSALLLTSDMPADGYSRGAEAPLLANDPSLFYRGATENLCRVIADQVVDNPKGGRYQSAKADEAVADLVRTVMGLSAVDVRAQAAQGILGGHYAAAQAAGKSKADALKSTFILACTSPSAVSIGL